ncbi:MAG: peptidoglycan editing factor PgeF [Oscillospiraceae bacterium]|nr:peptidoglycan editing factor PgeF [Oscillospiraceae bacterium]
MAIVTRRDGDLVYLVDEDIPVPHMFTTRLGGVSSGVYASLNLGQNREDDAVAVAENYDRVTAVLGTSKERLVFSRQVHGDVIRTVGETDCLGDVFRPITHEADGLVTAEPDVTLAVFTADCIPILLWDAGTGAVGAVHAGWRSTVSDIAGKAVARLIALGADTADIRVAIGPGIGLCCFETGAEVPSAVRAVLGAGAEDCIRGTDNGKSMVDLKAVNRRLLIRAGVLPERISVAAACTMCEHETFWSHRVTGGVRGSQAAMIRM